MPSKQRQKAILQFKVRLEGINPSVWRRLQVPDTYSFWDFHVAIQDAMGWWDYHLHEFMPGSHSIYSRSQSEIKIGIPDDEFGIRDIESGWEIPLVEYFQKPGDLCSYLYDFGDSWHHTITLEGIMLAEPRAHYPKCLDGENACPPEDCGGIPGYEQMLVVLNDPEDDEYKNTIEWLKEMVEGDQPFDPSYFDAEKVKFDNPKKRLKTMLED